MRNRADETQVSVEVDESPVDPSVIAVDSRATGAQHPLRLCLSKEVLVYELESSEVLPEDGDLRGFVEMDTREHGEVAMKAYLEIAQRYRARRPALFPSFRRKSPIVWLWKDVASVDRSPADEIVLTGHCVKA